MRCRMQCGDGFYFRMLANEVPIRMDLRMTKYENEWLLMMGVRYRIFEVEPFLKQWVDILKSNEMDNCLYDDFVKICDEPVCKA